MQAFLSTQLRDAHAAQVNFGNWLQLTGFRFAQDASGLTLLLHWRSLRKTYRRWRCFVHGLSGAQQIFSLDHAILKGRPQVPDWEPGDEGYELLRHWLKEPPANLALRLGIYDPEINVRCAVLASTLPVLDESTAVLLTPNREPGSSYFVQFDPVPLIPCDLEFDDGLELTGYSASRHDQLLWLRLKWTLRGWPRRTLRFFGHVVAELTAEAPTLLQFDQDLPLERRGPATALEQHVIRALGPADPAWLRVGIFNPSNLRRLKILRAGAMDQQHRCAFLSLANL